MSARKSTAPPRVHTYGDEQLKKLQRHTFKYFWKETNPRNGLIPDNTAIENPASIAGVGFALASYPIAVDRSYVTRARAVARTLATLRFFSNAPQGPMPDATGHRGFFYHFLDVETGRRAWRCELSTIDTTILIAGALTAAAYFDRATDAEREVRQLADDLYPLKLQTLNCGASEAFYAYRRASLAASRVAGHRTSLDRRRHR